MEKKEEIWGKRPKRFINRAHLPPFCKIVLYVGFIGGNAMNPFIGVLLLYTAVVVTFLIHEGFHIPLGGIKVKSWFPIPIMSAQQSLSRIGGLIGNLVLVIGIYKWNPQILFIQLIGAISLAHLLYYLILGSIIKEAPDIPSKYKIIIYDDVPNQWIIFTIPLAILLAIYFGPHYLNIFKEFSLAYFGGVL